MNVFSTNRSYNFAFVGFLLCQYLLPTLYGCCLVKQLIQKRLNISIQQAKCTHFVDQLSHKYSLKCTVLVYKIFRGNTPDCHCPIPCPPNVEHKSAPVDARIR